jgi:flagellar biosynthesis protein FlhA
MLAGYTVVDPATVIATHLTEVFRRHLGSFLGRQEVQGLLDNLGKTAPKAVEELVPGLLPLGIVQKVLQNLLRENISIRDLLSIVESLADNGGLVKNPELLTEYVRERLSRTIVKPYLDSHGALPIITLDPKAEQTLQESVRQTENGVFLALSPGLAQRLMQRISQTVEQAVNTDGQPVLLVSPMVRPHLAQLVIRFLPSVPVLSQAEIPSDIRLASVGNVGVD